MKHFPIYLAVEGRKIVLSGGGAAALAKLRLLLKTEARIEVFAPNPAAEIVGWANESRLALHQREVTQADLTGAVLIYAADEDAFLDSRTATMATKTGIPANIVDNLADSAFITPAIVDRDPVTIAIGTEGAAPVLARALKADLEEHLSPRLGLLARAGRTFRSAADALPFGRARRDFWRDYFLGAGPRLADEAKAKDVLETLLTKHLSTETKEGHVAFVGAGPGDPELLTLKARKALDTADVVIHDRLVSAEILELVRREATILDVGKQGFGPSTAQDDINALIVEHGLKGAQVVRLKGGDATVFGRLDEEIEAVTAADISWHVVPGITAASASVAAIGQSLTRRGRNASVRFLTGHDMKGFADHDWRELAAPDQVAAIYMGKKAARFIQGRLLMHGALPDTPLTLVENASRHDQRVVSTTLAALPSDLADAALTGPALALLGLSPRAVSAPLSQPLVQEQA
ncbi:uroporphyrinogen-III C-methyltransferase [Shimia gijangensis]|uniref:Uroporphyrinogen-III C-methyltransferase n=1 Tax=Shimia gijangensis TaxID=1470563 RepID=A0A1M6NB14_9RHOB|nr:siroheme synthase CysG [Shimia gijangensis]SHJ92891.1 uroporphyrinogen-III C-methyltransferase [Shimia gijangensis]